MVSYNILLTLVKKEQQFRNIVSKRRFTGSQICGVSMRILRLYTHFSNLILVVEGESVFRYKFECLVFF
jgi:hypothetical protein